jgi:hypothetical protein
MAENAVSMNKAKLLVGQKPIYCSCFLVGSLYAEAVGINPVHPLKGRSVQ